MVPLVEKAMVDSGIILLKYWLEVSPEEQTRRLASRIDDGRKIWKLSPMDLKSYSRWYDYSRARDEMFAATDTDFAPWYVARSDDKKRARLNIITHLLGQDPLQERAAREGEAAEAAEGGRVSGVGLSVQVHQGAVLTPVGLLPDCRTSDPNGFALLFGVIERPSDRRVQSFLVMPQGFGPLQRQGGDQIGGQRFHAPHDLHADGQAGPPKTDPAEAGSV